VEELYPYWEKLGKALNLEEEFLHDIYDQFPMDPAKRLRIILRKWRDTTEHPSLTTLNDILKHFGLRDVILRRRSNNNSKKLYVIRLCHRRAKLIIGNIFFKGTLICVSCVLICSHEMLICFT